MNQTVAFTLLGVGAVALTKAITGASWSSIVAGHPGTISTSGQVLGNGVAGVGQAAAGAAGKAKNTTPPGAVGQVTGAQLAQIGAAHGWSGQQLADWMSVINAESGGNPNAVNPSSGASGIAQFINGFGEYATYGGTASSVTGQLTAMANYIAQRYGNPSTAWAHEQSAHWY